MTRRSTLLTLATLAIAACSTQDDVSRHDGKLNSASARSVTRASISSKTCHIGGCSNQICSAEPGLASTCEWTDTYACYANAKCEVQVDGECGWTQTEELKVCLAGPIVCAEVLCAIYCEFGYVMDANGCNTCACAVPPKRCGGIQGLACASGEICVDDPTVDCILAQSADCTGVCVTAPIEPCDNKK